MNNLISGALITAGCVISLAMSGSGHVWLGPVTLQERDQDDLLECSHQSWEGFFKSTLSMTQSFKWLEEESKIIICHLPLFPQRREMNYSVKVTQWEGESTSMAELQVHPSPLRSPWCRNRNRNWCVTGRTCSRLCTPSDSWHTIEESCQHMNGCLWEGCLSLATSDASVRLFCLLCYCLLWIIFMLSMKWFNNDSVATVKWTWAFSLRRAWRSCHT